MFKVAKKVRRLVQQALAQDRREQQQKRQQQQRLVVHIALALDHIEQLVDRQAAPLERELECEPVGGGSIEEQRSPPSPPSSPSSSEKYHKCRQ
jgi:hypothetical protein